jgi:hypothetical protein
MSLRLRPFTYGGGTIRVVLYVTRGTVTSLALLDQQIGD